MPQVTPRSQWGSRFAFMMAVTGAAVGLGNIWKFPYMVGQNGGAIFFILYLIGMAMVGIPTLMAEVLLGKLGRQNAVGTWQTLAVRYGASRYWQGIGFLGMFALVMILGFYSVVAGWSVAYVVQSGRGLFQSASIAEIQAFWDAFLRSPADLLLWHSAFMILTLSVVALGVREGIERVAKYLTPALFLMLIFLVVYNVCTVDMGESATFLLAPDWSKVNRSMVLAAIGQDLFTLAVGAGAMLVYGSYLAPKTTIGGSILVVAALDALVALLAGFAIFPIVFSHGLSPAAGPDLMFKVLPIAFSEMAGGRWIGVCFFGLLLFAAWTSSISMAEPLVAFLVERLQLRRAYAALCVGALSWSVGIIALLSFNVWVDVHIFNWGIFQLITDIPTNICLPIGAFAVAVFAGWRVKAADAQAGMGLGRVAFSLWRFLIRWVAPGAIASIFIAGLLL